MGLDEGGFYLIAVGRLIPRKALHYLIQALSRLPSQVRLLLIGEGPEEGALAALAQGLGVASRVTFLGVVSEEEKFQYLANADLFVLPSLHEGFGLAFIEAMGRGLPVIATDSGGQTDFLRDGVTGFLVPVGDTGVLAQKVQMLLEDHTLREGISRHNRQYARQFSVSKTAQNYETLFEEVIG